MVQNKIARGKIEPFTIAVPDEVLADLRERLARTRLPDEVANSGWDYGTNLAYLKRADRILAHALRLARARAGDERFAHLWPTRDGCEAPFHPRARPRTQSQTAAAAARMAGIRLRISADHSDVSPIRRRMAATRATPSP